MGDKLFSIYPWLFLKNYIFRFFFLFFFPLFFFFFLRPFFILKLDYFNTQHRSALTTSSGVDSPSSSPSSGATPTTPDLFQQKGVPTPSQLWQRRRSSLQYCYQYTRRPSLPRHAIYMCPIDTDASTLSPTLLSSTATSRHASPLTPGSCLTTATATTTATTADSITSSTSNGNTLSLTSSVSNQSLVRRTLLIPKSPTSPTFWKRQHYFQYTKPPISPTSTTTNDSNSRGTSNSSNSTSNLRVLLVDDNDINLKVLEKALRLHMADIFEYMDMVSSGECAIEKLRQQAYDLILMDIDMPGLNGVDAASWIRRGHQLQEQRQAGHCLDTVLTQNRWAPIVAVTTNMSLEWKKTYLKVGMNGCLSKPISPIILRHSLTQVLMYGSYWDYSTS